MATGMSRWYPESEEENKLESARIAAIMGKFICKVCQLPTPAHSIDGVEIVVCVPCIKMKFRITPDVVARHIREFAGSLPDMPERFYRELLTIEEAAVWDLAQLNHDKASMMDAPEGDEATADVVAKGCMTINTESVKMVLPTTNAAIMTISHELMTQMFHLPAGTRIIGIRMGGVNLADVEMIVEHPDLPAVAFGEPYPHVSPQYKISPKRINATEFVGWGL